MPPYTSTAGYPTGLVDRLLWPLRDQRGDFPAPLIAAGDVALWIVWFLGMLQSTTLPLPAATLWVAAFGTGFVWRYSLSTRGIGTRRRIDPQQGLGSATGPEVLTAAATFSIFGHLWYVSYTHVPGITPPPPGTWDVLGSTAGGLVLALVVGVVVGPVMEEFCFRGWVLPTLAARYGPAAGIGVSSLLFAAVHANPAWIPYHFVSGVVFAAAVRLTGSVWVAVTMHACRNLVAQVQAQRFLAEAGSGGYATDSGGALAPALLGMTAAGGVLVLLAIRQRHGAGARR